LRLNNAKGCRRRWWFPRRKGFDDMGTGAVSDGCWTGLCPPPKEWIAWRPPWRGKPPCPPWGHWMTNLEGIGTKSPLQSLPSLLIMSTPWKGFLPPNPGLIWCCVVVAVGCCWLAGEVVVAEGKDDTTVTPWLEDGRDDVPSKTGCCCWLWCNLLRLVKHDRRSGGDDGDKWGGPQYVGSIGTGPDFGCRGWWNMTRRWWADHVLTSNLGPLFTCLLFFFKGSR